LIGDALKPAEATVYIENRRVLPKDLGSAVTFIDPHKAGEHGYITSLGRYPGTVFVRFLGPNGEMCSGKQLRWGHI
jgi:hypothetical protein